MARSYGVKQRDFGLQRGGVFLPDLYSGSADGAIAYSPQSSSYRSAMPAYSTSEQRAHGKLSISSGASLGGKSPKRWDEDEAVYGEKTSKREKRKSWFGRKKKEINTPPSNEAKTSRRSSRDVVDGANSITASPLLHVRSVSSAAEWDPSGRAQLDPGALGDEERMVHSYEVPVEPDVVPTHLIRLTLRSSKSKKLAEPLRVTLRRKDTGFGIHLSTGLPPITVTFVEPGGEAEAAGVRVGDVVEEVNGEKYDNEMDAAKVVSLKMMIQKTKIRHDDTEDLDSIGEGDILNETAWRKIHDRQLQEDKSSSSSSPVEFTQIDDESDNEVVMENFLKQAEKNKTKVEISQREWEQMKEQRELVFNRNAPSAVIQESSNTRNRFSSPLPKEEEAVSSAIGGLSPPSLEDRGEGGGGKERKRKHSTSFRSWFRRKKTSQTSDKKTMTPETYLKGKDTPKKRGGSLWKRKERSFERTERETDTHGPARESSNGGYSERGGREWTEQARGGGRGGGGGGRRGGGEYRGDDEEQIFSRIDEIDGSETKNAKTKMKLKTGPPVTSERSRSRDSSTNNPHTHKLILPSTSNPLGSNTRGKPHSNAAPVVAHQRSKSYQLNLSGSMGEEILGTDWAEEKSVSKSQSDISKAGVEGGGVGGKVGGAGGKVGGAGVVEMDAQLKVRKSGVVIGPGSRSSSRRPSLGVDLGSGGRGGEETDVHVPLTASSGSKDSSSHLDLNALPQIRPCLGMSVGHARRDLVARSSQKRRPASNRASLLLKVADDEKMGRKRVELSDRDSGASRMRINTMPEKITRRMISDPTSSLPADPARHTLIKELHEQNMFPSSSSSSHPSPPSLQRHSSTSSTSSTAAIVAKAVARRQTSRSANVEDEKMTQTEKNGVLLKQTSRSSSIEEHNIAHRYNLNGVVLTNTRSENDREKNNDTKSPAKNEKERKTEEEEEVEEEGERAGRSSRLTSRPSSASRTRRLKTVEKPVKSLGIASEDSERSRPSTKKSPQETKRSPRGGERSPQGSKRSPQSSKVSQWGNGRTPPFNQHSQIKLRKTPSSERFGHASTSSTSSSTSSNTPSWMAIAERKTKRMSAILGEQSLQDTPTSKQTTPTSKQATPTSKQTKPTSKQATPTYKQATPTSKQTTPTSKQATPTSVKATPTKQATPTSRQAPPTSSSKGLPMRGHVRDRLALFQK